MELFLDIMNFEILSEKSTTKRNNILVCERETATKCQIILCYCGVRLRR